MEIKEGYVYHIKNSYFELVNDNKLMKNHEWEFDKTKLLLRKDGK